MARRAFHTVSMTEGTSMLDYIISVQRLADDLKSLDQEIDELLIVYTMLAGLQEDYRQFITSLEATEKENSRLSM